MTYLSKGKFSHIILAAIFIMQRRSNITPSSPEVQPAKKKWLTWNLRLGRADKEKALNNFLVI
jgi:hypothetical protein